MFEDSKGVIRIRKVKDKQHNGLKKKNKGQTTQSPKEQKNKRTNNDPQNIHIKLKIE